jgi:outer membrane biosynthesis protein TonB
MRNAVLGGQNGPINVGPVPGFGDTGLPAPKGIIGPIGSTVNGPGVIGTVRDGEVVPTQREPVPQDPPRNTQPAPNPPQNTQPAPNPPRNTQPAPNPPQNTQPAPNPPQNTQPAPNPPRNTQPAPNPPRNPQPDTVSPTGDAKPGAVQDIAGPQDLVDGQSLEQLLGTLIDAIEAIVTALESETPGAPTEPSSPAAEPSMRPRTASSARNDGTVTFSIKASAEWIIPA